MLWSIFGEVDVVAVATGKTLPTANVKTIQPMEIGIVRAIHVRNGQHVRKGQLLIELDPTMAGAEEAQATRGLLSSRIELRCQFTKYTKYVTSPGWSVCRAWCFPAFPIM